MALSRQRDGEAAEALAARHLEQAGLRILERNYRCRGGELDLIAQEGGTLVFVEVRLRRSNAFGGAAQSIDRRKQERVLLAARHYLIKHGDVNCRFDVVLLDALRPDRLEWMRNAFEE